MADRAYLERLTRQLADDGRLIEAGWVGLRLDARFPKDPTADQLATLRLAYIGGVQHVWASIFDFLDEDSEPTATDMRRMDLIAAEIKQIELELRPAAGRG